MAGMLAVPLKQAENINYQTVLRNFISENYDDPPGAYDHQLHELSKMKSSATAAENHTSGIGHLLRYYIQLKNMADKFPFTDEAQIRVNFQWSDSLKGGKKVGSKDVQYEAGCVMYNVGAVHSHLGASTTLTDEGCKTACTAFQNAAGAFAYVRDVCHVKFVATQTPDMSTEALTVLVNTMLGQAQECFYRKAQLGSMKNAILAKLAAQAADYYQEASTGLEAKSLKGVFPKNWVATIEAKRDLFALVANYRQGLASQDASDYGVALGYLMKADGLAKAAMKACKNAGFTDTLINLDNLASELRILTKDNDTIYHEAIPMPDALPAIARAPMVKEVPPTLEIAGAEDLFVRLVPITIRRSYARYMEEVDKLIRNECDALDAAMAYSSKTLGELGMPAALDAIERPVGVPDTITQKSKSARERGGVPGLRDKLENVKNLHEQNTAVLNEALRMLDEEQHQDSQLRARFISEWNRTPSDKLTKELRDEARSMQSKLDAARRADGLVRQKFEDSFNIIDSLCRTDALPSLLPSAGPATVSEKAKELIGVLRDLIAKNDACRKGVPEIKEEFLRQRTKGDITAKLVAASKSASDENQAINDHLQEVFGPTREKAANNIKQQKQLIEEIKRRANEFQGYFSANDVTRKRETVLNNLGVAYDKFEELNANLTEGYKFYTDMLDRLLRFQTKCSDYSEARKAEAEELQRRIQTRPPVPPQPQPQAGQWQPGMPVQFGGYGPPQPQAPSPYAPNYPPNPYGHPAYPPQPGGYPPNPYGR